MILAWKRKDNDEENKTREGKRTYFVFNTNFLLKIESFIKEPHSEMSMKTDNFELYSILIRKMFWSSNCAQK